ncbi:MAG: toxin-antitoxin system HicB family antitoxin [Armatimonadetes bacterium]|nr:toxin-antitoxin system HicB family antitoxin [Armatimonadota bacterium]NOG93753.1 toxin-antitoxin system HicB family antitoxin [Armatimonadota bacterium]
MKDIEKTISEYGTEIIPLHEQDGGGYLAVFPQLGHVITGLGETRDEALQDLLSSVPTLIASLEEHKDKLPKPEVPSPWRDFSGRVTLRIPRYLHAQLDRLAEREGVSLNSFMLMILQSGATAIAAGCQFGAAEPRGVRFSLGAEPSEPQTAGLRREYEHLISSVSEFFDKVSHPYWEGFAETHHAPRQLPDNWELLEQETA